MPPTWKRIPITKCGFGIRLIRTLQNMGIKTLGQAAETPMSEILRHKNCGRGSTNQLETVLKFINARVCENAKAEKIQAR